MGQIPLLNRPQEIASAKCIEATRERYRHSMLATDYVLQGAAEFLERVRDGKLRLDRTIEVSVTNTTEKKRIMKRIGPNLATLRHLLKQNVTVKQQFGDAGRVKGHAGQVNQVFMNLLTNAAQALAGRDNATITITTTGDDESVVVKIADNGPGISPDVLPRIWDPFFTTKDVGEGTGLGLSIVHELVERHGGRVIATNVPGGGAVFELRLPAAGAPPPPAKL